MPDPDNDDYADAAKRSEEAGIADETAAYERAVEKSEDAEDGDPKD